MLTDKIPISIAQDNKLLAVADSLSNALNKIYQQTNQVLLLPNLDNLNSDVLDHLAWQWHVDEYDINLDVDIKRRLIRDSLNYHKIKGTPAAVQRVLDLFFVGSYIKEWFEYQGNPYYFKIFAQSMRDIGDGDISFWRMLFDAKNVRSWLESIDLELPTEEDNLYHAVAEPMGGNIFTGLDLPADNENILSHAIAEPIAGYEITKTFDEVPTPIRNYHAMTELVTGYEIVKADLVLEYEADTINLFFKFPSGHRKISMPHPKSTPLAEDIRALSKLSADKEILLNKKGEITTGISRAILITESKIKVL